ncbi:hypothetical protein WJX73_005336 [Symbiochloris irregularis]|uniref:Ribosome maturation factor RimM n=1 Tax=Symbiochloris irregularis TaxID=706552 RepID=A0AAW1NJX8_9CHLO
MLKATHFQAGSVPVIWRSVITGPAPGQSRAFARPQATSTSPQLPHPPGSATAAPSAEDSLGLPATTPSLVQPGPQEADLLEIGIFISPHGLQGEIRLQLTTDFAEERLSKAAVRWVQAQPKGRHKPAPVQIEVKGGRPSIYKGHEIWLVRVAGVTTPEQAGALRNHRLLMLASDCHQLEDQDEFYSRELIGMQVLVQSSQQPLGVVSDVYDGTGTQNTLRIQLLEAGATCLIPFVKSIVPVVDRTQGIMYITPPEGLLDLVVRPRSKPARQKAVKLRQSRGQAGPASSAVAMTEAA